MGLDATVYCNCWETGRIRKEFSRPELVCVDPDGSLGTSSEDSLELELLIEFDKWRFYEACEHEFGELLHYRIGNEWLVQKLFYAIEGLEADFPIVIEKVLYSGTHCADFLSLNEVAELQKELITLAEMQCKSKQMNTHVQRFRQEMEQLCETALQVQKPIAF